MTEIDNIEDFKVWLNTSKKAAIQNLDLKEFENDILKKEFDNSIFLGCDLSDNVSGHIVKTGGLVIPDVKEYFFEVHRGKLYHPRELFKGFDLKDPDGYENTYDYKIYKQYKNQGKDKPDTIMTSLLRRLHDHSMTDALNEVISKRKVVAVMGGHGMERQDEFYLKVAKLSRKLTKKGFLMVSGGGPGAMEATHLGAFFAERSEEDLNHAINEMKVRPEHGEAGKEYKDKDWLHRAWKVMKKYPIEQGKEDKCMSVGIPTWLYGHEPPAPFATHIAKYFANSVREDGLLSIAKHGVIFAPGSAGTTQEIFQDATQNHYKSMGYISPMILFGIKRWTVERPLWDFLKEVSKNKIYGELLALTDNEDEIIRRILSYNPEIYKV
ncbi:LOG family protein [Croceitalea sp. MTPC9]|uniref:LOG family protein n=1 Tax=unclassified Croceitalea TaxID=2632280 RepID=UPI002B3AC8AB|nr:LOG family protein [Croceitalea sp. MTPC6]GMN15697.1 LOG family protein [Croceitalea sp. MTPC9]